MARYVMASRRAGKFHEPEKMAARAAFQTTFAAFSPSINLVADNNPADDQARRTVVFDASPEEMAVKMQTLSPDVMLEPEIIHWPDGIVRPTDIVTGGPAGDGANAQLTVSVRGGGNSLPNAEVLLFLRGALPRNELEQKARTNSAGNATFTFRSIATPAAVVVVPSGGFWSMVVRGPTNNVTVDCPPLPADGPIAWWHRLVGVNAYQADRGNGVRVGVVDTGAGPHAFLAHVNDAGAFIDGQVLPPPQGRDVDSHGTHVCGTIGARPMAAGAYSGIAPGADLFSARVFRDSESGANQGDIANAIDELSKIHRVDLINMSLGAPPDNLPSQIEHDAIRDAIERGTLCVVAAGNDGVDFLARHVFPAAFPEVVAVSALGLSGWGPPGSLAAGRIPTGSTFFGANNLYLANFSNFGEALACAAPGVGVIASVPGRFGLIAPYASMDGTSMASPVACGALAVLLSTSTNYLGMPRDQSRAAAARSILRLACRDIGLPVRFQGRGVPVVS